MDSRGELLGTPPGLPHERWQDLTPSLDVGEDQQHAPAAPTGISDESEARWARRQLDRETPRVEIFRSEYKRAAAFFAGDQVDEADRSALESSGRPIITLNATQRFIRIVDGVERRVPLSIFYVARDPSDESAARKAELRTKVKEWVYDRAEAPYEIARAKHDRNVGGMGWTDSYISRREDPAGIIEIQRFSPMEAIWPQSSRENLTGTRWRARERDMPVELAIEKWPRAAAILTAAGGGEGGPHDYPIKADLVKYRVPWVMTEPTNKGSTSAARKEDVRITDFQYAKSTQGYYFKDPVLDKFQWLPSTEFMAYSRRLSEFVKMLPRNVEKVTKDVYWRLFLMNRSFLLSGPEKMPIDGFSLNCLTGDWDEKRKIWYGMVRLFFDPQLLVDKLASSAVEIIGVQTKGGFMVEVGAASETQIEELKKDGSKPGSVLQFKRNALAEHRVMPKPTPQVPAGTVTMLEFGLKAMETLSGITESILSPPGATPGVGLRQRLSIGLLLLASYFDSSLRFERKQGEITQRYMGLIADDRWVRIGGPFDSEAVQLAKEDFREQYDTTVDDTEQDPTLRQLYTEHVLQIAPTLIRTNNFIPELLDWMRLPVQFTQKLKQKIAQNAQQQMQMRLQGIAPGGRGKQRTPQEIQAELARTQGQGQVAFAKAEHLHAQAREIAAGRAHSDLRGLLDALIDSHHTQLERERLEHDKHQGRLGAMRDMADMYNTLRATPGGAPGA